MLVCAGHCFRKKKSPKSFDTLRGGFAFLPHSTPLPASLAITHLSPPLTLCRGHGAEARGLEKTRKPMAAAGATSDDGDHESGASKGQRREREGRGNDGETGWRRGEEMMARPLRRVGGPRQPAVTRAVPVHQ